MSQVDDILKITKVSVELCPKCLNANKAALARGRGWCGRDFAVTGGPSHCSCFQSEGEWARVSVSRQT